MHLISPLLSSGYRKIETGNASPRKEDVLFDMLLAELGLGLGRGDVIEGVTSIRYSACGFRKSSVHRGDFISLLASLLPSERIICSARCTLISQSPNSESVTLTFSSGALVTAAAVLGCDGGRSITRSAVLGAQAAQVAQATEAKAVFAGRYAYRATLPMETARSILGPLVDDGKMFLGHGCYITSYPLLTHSGQASASLAWLNVLAAKQASGPWPRQGSHAEGSHEGWTQRVSRSAMMDDFPSGAVDERLRRLIEHADPVRWAFFHHPETETYHSGLVYLVGDAAHAMTPHQGAGAGLCIEDAYTLARCLGAATLGGAEPSPSTPSERIRAAFGIYDGLRRGRAQEIVRTSDEAGRMYCLDDPEMGADFGMVVEDMKLRFRGIWDYDLQNAVEEGLTTTLRQDDEVHHNHTPTT
jgi:salicylate hydroxylase